MYRNLYPSDLLEICVKLDSSVKKPKTAAFSMNKYEKKLKL